MPELAPFREEHGAVVDAHGRIVIPAYERRGEAFNGTNPHLHPMTEHHILRLRADRLLPSFMEWIEGERIDAYSPHVDQNFTNGVLRRRYARMDRHWTSEYCNIGYEVEDTSTIAVRMVTVGFREFEDFTYAKLRFK